MFFTNIFVIDLRKLINLSKLHRRKNKTAYAMGFRNQGKTNFCFHSIMNSEVLIADLQKQIANSIRGHYIYGLLYFSRTLIKE